MMNVTNLLTVCVAIAYCCSGTASAAQERGESKKAGERGRGVRHERRGDHDKDPDSYFERHGYTRLDVPKGHIRRPANAISGIRIAPQDTSLLR
jgi:hypothetical protein